MDPDKPRRTLVTVEPLQVNMTRVVLVGTVLWAIGLVVLLVLRDTLAAHHAAWWIWTCVVGLALGGFGLAYVRK